MARYIQQLRRGWKDDTRDDWATYESSKYIEVKDYIEDTTYYLDKNGTVANPQPTDKDKVTSGGYYIKNPSYIPPLEGELVLEYDNGIPRLKIGNGSDDFSQLPYMSVDSFILPTRTLVQLDATETKDGITKSLWIQETSQDGELINRYYQVVKDDEQGINRFVNATITPNSKIDLQPSPDQLVIFHEKDLAFVTENDNGKVTVYCIGQQPQNDYTIQVAITEVVIDG